MARSPNPVTRPPWAPSDRYESRERIDAGAMGAVHVCRDRRIGRDVAIKVIHSENAADAPTRIRFEREARVQGKLEHPAIVPVYDMGLAPDGNPFFTMKRVEGSNLRSILARLAQKDPAAEAEFPQRRLLAAFGKVCLAVDHAHSKGVVHCDIKPGNIMFGQFDEVYLLDWGVAKINLVSALPFDDTDETTPLDAIEQPTRARPGRPGREVVGTMGYMAPEQIVGDPVEESADIYSLGATLFELLALTPLHPRENGTALESTLNGADARISVRAPSRVVAPELEKLCVQATSRRKHERPARARDMHAVIERVLGRENDAERARELAAELAAAAREEARQALKRGVDSADARTRALRAVHRALAFDPDDAVARDVLTRLAALPLRESVPTDAQLRASARRTGRVLTKASVALLAAWLGGIGLVITLGVRSAAAVVVQVLLVGLALALVIYRARAKVPWSALVALTLADAAAAAAGALFGPFVLVPGLLATTTVACALGSWPSRLPLLDENGGRPQAANEQTADADEGRGEAVRDEAGVLRPAALLLAFVAFLGPVLLEAAGLLPPSLAIRDGAIVLLPRAVAFPAGRTLAVMALLNVATIFAPVFVALRARDHTLAVERRAQAKAAHLRELLPWQTRDAVDAAARTTGTNAFDSVSQRPG